VPEDALSFVMARRRRNFSRGGIADLRERRAEREAAEVLNLGPSDGYPPLKEALLEMLHHDGIPAKDENLLITDGCSNRLI